MKSGGGGRVGAVVLGMALSLVLVLLGFVTRRSVADGGQAGDAGGSGGRNGAGSGQAGGQAAKQTPDQGRSRAEWVSLGMSGAIVLALIGLVTYEHFAYGTEPAIIVAEPRLDELRPAANAYYLPVMVTNRGGQVAEAVIVRVSLQAGQGEPESSELTIDFLAGRASAEGTAVFREDPSRGRLTASVLSYLQP